MTYDFLQHYWWFLVSLLGALLVFLLFVQGANSLIFSLARTDIERRLVVNSTGRKWEFTFTTLVVFGGGFFASFPLFYSTSFGGAYWLWMTILFSFVMQAVSYEFQNKIGNLLGARTFQVLLIINGIVGPLLLGGAVATFFNGSNFIVDKGNITSLAQPVISRWANCSHGLDALLDIWNLLLGIAIFFLARVLGALYILNNVKHEAICQRARRQQLTNAVVFLVLFLTFLVRTLLKDGYAYNPQTGLITMEPMKYLAPRSARGRWRTALRHSPHDSPHKLHPRHLACRRRSGINGAGVAALHWLEPHCLLSLKCRSAKFAHHCQQLRKPIHTHGHVNCVASHPLCSRLHLHRLARHRP